MLLTIVDLIFWALIILSISNNLCHSVLFEAI